MKHFKFILFVYNFLHLVCIGIGEDIKISGVLAPHALHFGENVGLSITLLDNPIHLDIHDCFFLDFYEGDTSIHRTACLSLEANVLPASCKDFNIYNQCKQLTLMTI